MTHLDWVVRASLVFALALLATALFRRRSAVARRLVLTIAFVAVLVIPLVPTWHVGGPSYQALVGRLVAEPSSGPGGTVLGNVTALPKAMSVAWLGLGWLVGAFVAGARFVLGLVLAHRLAKRASAVQGWDAILRRAERITGIRPTVRVSSEIDAPVLAGLFSPVTLVPASSVTWSDERKLAVLLHELAHVAAHDLGVQVLVNIVCTLHWFNPLAWLAARRLRLERELAADEAVLQSGVRASSYASDLLAIAGAGHAGTISIAEEPLARRITAIVAANRPGNLGARRTSALVAGSSAIALAVACTTTSESTASKVSSVDALDRELQEVAERELDRTVKAWNAAGGTILVVSVRGEVLANVGHADDPYVTGSTLKPMLLAAAIDEGVVTETDVFDCTNGERAGKVLHDASPLGHIALPELVARSGNIGFARIFDRLGGARTDRAFRGFQLATPPELAAARPGDWDGALIAIGATMTSTPRQVARAYVTLAAGGDEVVKASTSARVGALLEGVVAAEHGTGKKARIAGVRVAGKTGSSEWTAADGREASYASFVGYVPAEAPRYVIFVGVESPKGDNAWGGEVAAPVFARIASRALAR